MALSKYAPITEVVDDGLRIPEVGEWGLEKYRLVGHYADLFTSTMKSKWENLVYIDLFSSSGYARIETTGKIVKSSAMIALSLSNPFTKYIFCDENELLINDLEIRVKRDFPNLNTVFVKGNCNTKINEILSHIPQFSKTNRVLSFCFVDPFALEIHFLTLKLLGRLKMDFLILIATGMAAKRNENNYSKPNNKTIENFLQDPDWRNDYKGDIDTADQSFTQFVTGRLKSSFKLLEYNDIEDFHPVRYRLNGKSVLLYHLAFFSKDKQGNKFWNISKSYVNEQTSLF
ncbi:three-Cys-motif partner protein TcmP [Pedobacter frigiditerrae]|uniref:Three-Cys-motif partner protein TcmP n=1 Tax=Pedobacter frigiditerrae TaxID=2530452 RepID=A0A4R0N5Y8_9SPHI|nr:three-Cys-motif partner protein TcmP [Pedobacter frigiditerrae]TCC94032.1 three-Cys-motif partner protein TcmP [Pedobacter frigiditerrae]